MQRTSLVGAIACGLVLVTACGGSVTDAPDSASLPQLELWEQPVADAPDPADRAGAASDFVECEYGLWNGGWSMDFGGVDAAGSPDAALASFVGEGLFGLPGEGYIEAGRDTGRLLYTYSADGAPRVAVIVADGATGSWTVETFAACDPAEYDRSTDDDRNMQVWLDGEGNRVPTSIISSLPGADHCGWESVTYLLYQDRQYISDPGGVMNMPFVVRYDDDAELPADAANTGYHRDGSQLWVSRDGDVAYLVGEDRTEAWPTPATPEPVWCD